MGAGCERIGFAAAIYDGQRGGRSRGVDVGAWSVSTATEARPRRPRSLVRASLVLSPSVAQLTLCQLGRAPSDVAIHPGLCVRVSAELADMSSEFAGVDLAQHQLLSAYASAQAANPTAESLGIPTQLGNDFVEADFGDEDDRPKSKRKRADGDLSNDQRKVSHVRARTQRPKLRLRAEGRRGQASQEHQRQH